MSDGEVIGLLGDGYDSQGEDEVERVAALLSKDRTALRVLNLGGVAFT